VCEALDAFERRAFAVRASGYEGVPVALGIVTRQSAEDTISVLPQDVYAVAFPTSAE
jgi:hypothetical protein